MSELGKAIVYVILIILLLAAFALVPAAVGVGELANKHRAETGEGR
jgi:uncharacterized protein YqfA (UPF0365 family)